MLDVSHTVVVTIDTRATGFDLDELLMMIESFDPAIIRARDVAIVDHLLDPRTVVVPVEIPAEVRS